MAEGKKMTGKKTEKKVTRYTYDDIKEPRMPETGHTSLLPADEQVVTLPMDNGWSKAIEVGKLPEDDERPVVVDMDPAADPVLFWAGKRNRREVPVLPLQRNEIVSSRASRRSSSGRVVRPGRSLERRGRGTFSRTSRRRCARPTEPSASSSTPMTRAGKTSSSAATRCTSWNR